MSQNIDWSDSNSIFPCSIHVKFTDPCQLCEIKTFSTGQKDVPENLKFFEESGEVYWSTGTKKTLFVSNVFDETTKVAAHFDFPFEMFCISKDRSIVVFTFISPTKTETKKIVAFSLITKKQISSLHVGNSKVHALDFTNDNDYIFMSSGIGKFDIYNVKSRYNEYTFRLGNQYRAPVVAYSWNSQHNFAVVFKVFNRGIFPDEDNYISELWLELDWKPKQKKSKQPKRLFGTRNFISCLFSENGLNLFVAFDERVEIWSVRDCTVSKTLKIGEQPNYSMKTDVTLELKLISHRGDWLYGLDQSFRFFRWCFPIDFMKFHENEHYQEIALDKTSLRMVTSIQLWDNPNGLIAFFWISTRLIRSAINLMLLFRKRVQHSPFHHTKLPLDVFKLILFKTGMIKDPIAVLKQLRKIE